VQGSAYTLKVADPKPAASKDASADKAAAKPAPAKN